MPFFPHAVFPILGMVELLNSRTILQRSTFIFLIFSSHFLKWGSLKSGYLGSWAIWAILPLGLLDPCAIGLLGPLAYSGNAMKAICLVFVVVSDVLFLEKYLLL